MQSSAANSASKLPDPEKIFENRQAEMRDQLAKRLGFTFREGESMQDGLKRYFDIKQTEGDIKRLEAQARHARCHGQASRFDARVL